MCGFGGWGNIQAAELQVPLLLQELCSGSEYAEDPTSPTHSVLEGEGPASGLGCCLAGQGERPESSQPCLWDRGKRTGVGSVVGPVAKTPWSESCDFFLRWIKRPTQRPLPRHPQWCDRRTGGWARHPQHRFFEEAPSSAPRPSPLDPRANTCAG